MSALIEKSGSGQLVVQEYDGLLMAAFDTTLNELEGLLYNAQT